MSKPRFLVPPSRHLLALIQSQDNAAESMQDDTASTQLQLPPAAAPPVSKTAGPLTVSETGVVAAPAVTETAGAVAAFPAPLSVSETAAATTPAVTALSAAPFPKPAPAAPLSVSKTTNVPEPAAGAERARDAALTYVSKHLKTLTGAHFQKRSQLQAYPHILRWLRYGLVPSAAGSALLRDVVRLVSGVVKHTSEALVAAAAVQLGLHDASWKTCLSKDIVLNAHVAPSARQFLDLPCALAASQMAVWAKCVALGHVFAAHRGDIFSLSTRGALCFVPFAFRCERQQATAVVESSWKWRANCAYLLLPFGVDDMDDRHDWLWLRAGAEYLQRVKDDGDFSRLEELLRGAPPRSELPDVPTVPATVLEDIAVHCEKFVFKYL